MNIKCRSYINKYLNLMIILIFIIICLCGLFQPIMADDYVYYNDIHRMSLFKYITMYYFNWSGRVFSTLTTGLILKSDFINNYIGIINGIVLILIVFLVTTIALKRKPKVFSTDRLTFLLAFCTIWFGTPVLGECVYWKTGAAFYSYPILLSLIFILPYIFYYKHENITKNFNLFLSIIMFVFGVIVGFSHEQVFVVLFCFNFFFYVYKRKKCSDKLPTYLIMGTIGLVIGGIILIFSPGNFARLKTEQASLFYKFAALGGYFLIYYFISGAEQLWIWIVTILLIAYIIKLKGLKKETYNSNIKWSLLWGIMACCSIAPMFIFASSVTARTCFIFIVFLTIALVSLLNVGLKVLDYINSSKIGIIVTVLIVNIIFCDLLVGITNNYMLYKQVQDRNNYIVSQKSKGDKDIEVAPFDIYPHKATYDYDIKIDPNHWTNGEVKEYYKLNSIKINHSLQKYEVEESSDTIDSIKHYWENKLKKK